MSESRIIRPYPADDHDHHDDFNDLGLNADMNMLARPVMDRRRVLSLGLLGIGVLVGCGAGALGSTPGTGTSTGGGAGTDTCPAAIPSETAGPYPADGSAASGQSLNVLTRSGIVRPDLRTSLGTGHVAAGVPLTLTLRLVNVNASCAPLAGYAVYLWHCTQDGNYSMYSPATVGEDYLRGVQAAGPDGTVTFTTIFPGCYMGRWPHIHFEVYPTLASATTAGNKIQTSQLALPEATCREVYATTGYSASVRNLNSISLARDNVFSDGHSSQMAAITGSPSAGYAAALTVGLTR
ncbi:protocatechuate 3,4-dioxygenase beta subunit [Deinococcus sp. HSC-46F16]|uniref:intradiol ring-cleavage dioxygenase n=1 Tax=Deinococcus sp. HSC-46F16 TaxID=2910968 RepID=UPI00209F93C6|nr:intradiol ring-cleavage dioxygenase [Deinococcus sp. HSC-46F16]MCP2014684.1 protocatechuate 3,4-dioxygenase beta subunit [Deinococcus sp. HSC-46F16]